MSAVLLRRVASVVSHALILLFALLIACDGTPSSPQPTTEPLLPPPTGPVSAVVDASGGVLEAVTSAGAHIRVTVPAGALASAEELTLRPLEPVSGRVVQVALEPEGQQFRKAVELRMQLPPAASMADMQLTLGMGDVPVTLAATKNTETRTLRTEALRSFGFVEAPDDDPPAPHFGASYAGASTGTGTGTNVVSAQVQTCQQVLNGARHHFDRALASRNFNDVQNAVLHIAGLLSQAGCNDAADDWINEASAAMCVEYAAVLQEVKDLPITDYGDFQAQMGPVVAMQALEQSFTNGCRLDWGSVMTGKGADYVQFATERASRIIAPDYAAFVNLRNDARTIFFLMSDAAVIGLDSFREILRSQAFIPTVNMARAAAYRLCGDGVWHYPLSRLTSVGFFAQRDIIGLPEPRPTSLSGQGPYAEYGDKEIFDDLQYCGTTLTFASHVVSGGQFDSETAGSLGAPGAFTKSLELQVPTRGTVALIGDLFAITCWNDVERDSRIVVELNGREAHSISRSGGRYIDGSLELEIADLAQAAGETPMEGKAATLRLRRPSTACPDPLYGERDFTLVTALIRWKNPSLHVSVAMPPAAGPGDDLDVEVRVAVVDQHGESAYFDDINIELEVQGGTAAQPVGRTNTDGYFRTSVSVPSGSAGPVSVRAVATSFEQVQAEGFATTGGVCPAPPSWAVAGITDDSGVGTGAGTASIEGPTITYLSVAGSAQATGNSSTHYSPGAGLEARALDYVRFVPLVPNPQNIGMLYADVHASGFAEARTSSDSCCGPFGDGRAEISVMSRWVMKDGALVRLEAAAGASSDSSLGKQERNTLDTTVRTPLLGGHAIDEWLDLWVSINGRAQHRGENLKAEVSARLNITILDIVDGNGTSVPTLICSAAGFNYGAPANGATAGVTASRPVHQLRQE